MVIKFGPAGIGAVKDAVENLKRFSELGLKACEIAFTYGVYIKREEDMLEIGKVARELGVRLSIHAPYWINLNSDDTEKIRKSKERILRCCEVGSQMGVDVVVFHPGYYGGMDTEQKNKFFSSVSPNPQAPPQNKGPKHEGFGDKEESYENIRDRVKEMQEVINKNNWKVKLAPETTGKVNVFGSVEEIARLVKETGCLFCLDFAHIHAREKFVDFEKIERLFGGYEKWHCHFSGIEYGEKGERRHVLTERENWKWLLRELPQDKEIVIINESPDPVGDSLTGLEILKS